MNIRDGKPFFRNFLRCSALLCPGSYLFLMSLSVQVVKLFNLRTWLSIQYVAAFGKGGTSLAFWESVYGFNMKCVGDEVVCDAN